MPIYEYQCAACGHRLEAMQKISEQPLKTCSRCNKDQLQKQVSAAGFQLKGGGWYKTEYSSKGKKKETDPAGGTDSESKASSTSGKTEN